MAVAKIGTGGDYSTIDLWEATLSGTFTEDQEGALYNENFTPSGTLGFGGFTTANPGILILRAATAAETGSAAAKHTGTAGTGARITKTNGGGWGIFYTTDANLKHFKIKDLELYSNGSLNPAVYPNNTAFDYCVIENVIVRDTQGAGFDLQKASSAATTEVINCILYNLSGNGPIGIIGNSTSTGVVKVYNSTVIRQETDVDVGVTGIRYCLCTNTGVFHFGPTSGHADFLNTGTGSNYCASSDTSSPGANSLDSVCAANQFTSIASASMNLALSSAGSVLVDAGTTITAVTTDIIGTTRS